VKISQEIITQIKEANPIEVVLGSYLSLKKAGKNYKALCPFHNEKTPSFLISPEKGIYHCFGCGKSGNVFTFIMEHNNLNFNDAVKTLAEKAGIKLQTTASNNENDELYRANEFAAEFFHSILLKNKQGPAWSWIKSRGMNESTIETFMLGYAPVEPILLEKAKTNKINTRDLEKLGLINNGRPSFRHKIIFPIRNRWNKVLGFGTRVLDDSEPKYINSMESPLFKKGNILYGLYETGKFLKEEAILVEGYMDLITLQQAGINNVVASMGTSLTETQAKALKLYTDKVIILYDGDQSGIKAAERAIDILLSASLEVKVLILPDNEDPDSFIRKFGKIDFSKAQSFEEFKFKNCATVEEKSALIKNFQQTLSKIPDEIRRELWATEIAQKLNINKKFLLESSQQNLHLIKRTVYHKNMETLEAELLGLASSSSKVSEILMKESFDATTVELKPFFDMVYKGIKCSELLNEISDETLKNTVTTASFLLENPEVDLEKMTRDYVNRIIKMKKNIRKDEIRKIIEKGTVSEETLREYQQLINS